MRRKEGYHRGTIGGPYDVRTERFQQTREGLYEVGIRSHFDLVGSWKKFLLDQRPVNKE